MDKIQKQFGKDKINKSVSESNSFVEVTEKLGLDPYKGHTRKNVERCVKRLNISVEHFDSIKRIKDSKTRWDKEKLIYLVNKYDTLNDILIELDILPVTTNYNSLKKYLKKYNIDYSHLKYIKKSIKVNWDDESYIKKIVSESKTQKEVLEKLGVRAAGGNFNTLKNYISKYNIDTTHFTKNYDKIREIGKSKKIPMENILVENSTYSRHNLKERLYEDGLKERKCELCGQDELWMGKKMSLILDHINGIYNDNRIENLRIVCPNCNATLPTHCNKNNSNKFEESVDKKESK